jgi:hypothetical protein
MMYEDGRLDRALVLARRAVDVYRFNSTARQVLIRTLGKLGRTGEGAEQFRLLKDLTEPEVKTSVEFQKTLEFRGYTLSSASAQPGGEVGIRYFWKVKGDPGPRHAITVFVHIESAEGRFQGDYQLLGGHERPLWPVLEHEIVIQDEWIRVPAHTVPGVYQILLGVYDRATGRKWPVSASESVEDRGRALVGVLRVEPKEGR